MKKFSIPIIIGAMVLAASLVAAPASACPCWICLHDTWCDFGHEFGGSECEEDAGGGCIFPQGRDCKCPEEDEDADDALAFVNSVLELPDGTIVAGKRIGQDAFSIRSCSGAVLGVLYDQEAANKRRTLARVIKFG